MRHPARYSNPIIPAMADLLTDCKYVLDPFAGTGRILDVCEYLPRLVLVTGVEIEHEWASMRKGIVCGNSLTLPFPDNSFDAIATSPVYGNRLSDHHNARDGSIRRSYTHDLGRTLHQDNSGTLQWGPAYRSFHEQAWAEATRVLRPGGIFVLNIKDHIRKRERQYVPEWHLSCLIGLGYHAPVYDLSIETPSMRFGANYEARLSHEKLFALKKK